MTAAHLILGVFQKNLNIWNQERLIYNIVVEFVSFETLCFQTLLGPTQVESVHVVWKFPEAVMEGSRPDTVSLLKQEIANCGLITQQIIPTSHC